MKINKTCAFGAIFILFISTFFFTTQTQGQRGVGEFNLVASFDESIGEEQVHIAKAVAFRNGPDHLSVYLSDNRNVSCEVNEKVLLGDTEKLISLDFFAPEGKELELERYTRKGDYKLGPAARVGTEQILFSGKDIGNVELTELAFEERYVAGEIHVHDMEGRIIEGEFEAQLCE